jgi:hypothetical protein
MNFKSVLLVVILGLLIGVGIVVIGNITERRSSNNLSSSVKGENSTPPEPSPIPVPSYPAITEKSNLGEEIKKLTPPDYAAEIKSLKEEVSK